MQILNLELDFWHCDTKNHFWANFDQKSQSCLYCLKIGTQVISRFLILVRTLVPWMSKSKSIFGQIWAEKVKAVLFFLKIDKHAHTHTESWRILILISILVFSKFKPKSWGCWFLFSDYFSKISNLNLFSEQIWVEKPEFSTLSGRCDYKNAEQGLEKKIKMNNCIKCLLLLYIYHSSTKLNQSIKEYWINGIVAAIKIFLIKKVLLQLKIWNKIKTTYKLLHYGPIHLTRTQLLACILRSYFRADQLTFAEWRTTWWSPVKWI